MKILYVGLGALGRMIVDDLKVRGTGEIVAMVDPAVDGVLPSLSAVENWNEIDVAIVTTSSVRWRVRAPTSKLVMSFSWCSRFEWRARRPCRPFRSIGHCAC